MRKIIVVCLVLAVMGLLPLTAHAGACGDFEYAELMDMDQATLLKAYCEVRKTGKVYVDVHMFAPRRDKSLYKTDADSCMDMMGKMERVYMKRFKIDNRDSLVAECK